MDDPYLVYSRLIEPDGTSNRKYIDRLSAFATAAVKITTFNHKLKLSVTPQRQ
jgi:hypothetical protein